MKITARMEKSMPAMVPTAKSNQKTSSGAPCSEATDSQVCEYARTWNANSLIVKRMRF